MAGRRDILVLLCLSYLFLLGILAGVRSILTWLVGTCERRPSSAGGRAASVPPDGLTAEATN
jgi:hypothetical protein